VSRVVLDASGLLAMIYQEPGGEAVCVSATAASRWNSALSKVEKYDLPDNYQFLVSEEI